ncbi:unnamed protein product [Urochloa humidicola]
MTSRGRRRHTRGCPSTSTFPSSPGIDTAVSARRVTVVAAVALECKPPGAVASTTNYVVPLDAAPSGTTRPLVEILRDINKRVPETIVRSVSRRPSASDPVIPW